MLVKKTLWTSNNSSVNCTIACAKTASDSSCILDILESLLISAVDIITVKQFEIWQKTTVYKCKIFARLPKLDAMLKVCCP